MHSVSANRLPPRPGQELATYAFALDAGPERCETTPMVLSSGMMLKRMGLSLVFLSLLAPAVSADVSISAIEWARPRNGQTIIQLPGLSPLVQQLLVSAENRLLVHYPGGEEGMLWAAEFRSWLVALGIDSARVELLPGTSSPDAMELSLARSPGWRP